MSLVAEANSILLRIPAEGLRKVAFNRPSTHTVHYKKAFGEKVEIIAKAKETPIDRKKMHSVAKDTAGKHLRECMISKQPAPKFTKILQDYPGLEKCNSEDGDEKVVASAEGRGAVIEPYGVTSTNVLSKLESSGSDVDIDKYALKITGGVDPTTNRSVYVCFEDALHVRFEDVRRTCVPTLSAVCFASNSVHLLEAARFFLFSFICFWI